MPNETCLAQPHGARGGAFAAAAQEGSGEEGDGLEEEEGGERLIKDLKREEGGGVEDRVQEGDRLGSQIMPECPDSPSALLE